MGNTEEESRTGSKQGEEEHHSKQGDEKAHLEEYNKANDVKDAVQKSLNPERLVIVISLNVKHQRILDAFIQHNTEASKKLKKINDKIKDGLIEELKTGNLSKSVKDAISYICEAKLHFADIQATLQFYMDVDAKSDIKRVFKKVLISCYSSITELLQLEHVLLLVIESNAKILNAKEPNVEITASCEKLQKSVDELHRDVCSLAGVLDMQPPVIPKDGHTTRVTSDLPIEVIREEIYRNLPAADVLCARLVNRNWYMAYTSGSLGHIQPARGGSIPLGFLLSTDKLQRRATAGLKMRHHFKGLEEKFPARDAWIIASSCGLYLIHMRNPEGMLILNPAVGQSRTINPPVSTEECAYTGMAVSFAAGSQVATRYCVVVPYCPHFINAFADNPRIRFRTWISQEGVWRINPSVINLEDFNPRNVVTVGQIIYFHISRDELVFYNVDEGEPGHLDMPLEVAGITEVALCSWQGALGILSYDMVDDNVEVYTLEDNVWIHKENIDMGQIVKCNRFAFRSLSLNLRSRDGEEASDALLDILVVGYVDAGWLLIRQRNGWILINVLAKAARRVHLGEMQRMFFGSRLSSFLRLS